MDVDAGRQDVQQVARDRQGRGHRDGDATTPAPAADRERDRAEAHREGDGRDGRGQDVDQGDMQPERGTEDRDRRHQHQTDTRRRTHHGPELLQDDGAAGHGVRQEQIERLALLLPGDRPRAGPDREDEEQQGSHRAEDLAAEVAHRRGDGAGADRVPQRLGEGLEVLVQLRRVGLDARIERRVEQDERRHADRPPDQRPALVAEGLRRDDHVAASASDP